MFEESPKYCRQIHYDTKRTSYGYTTLIVAYFLSLNLKRESLYNYSPWKTTIPISWAPQSSSFPVVLPSSSFSRYELQQGLKCALQSYLPDTTINVSKSILSKYENYITSDVVCHTVCLTPNTPNNHYSCSSSVDIYVC